MTTERMLELLILNKFMDRSPKVKGLTEKMISIPQVLEKEFLNPYVIDNAEKSE